MTITEWLKFRSTKSDDASNQPVQDFPRLSRDQGLPIDYDRGEKLAKLIGEPIPDVFREVYIQAINRMVYRIHNGEEWVRVDDPSADKVWSSMDVEPERREAMRELYAAPDKEADLLKIMNRPGGFEELRQANGADERRIRLRLNGRLATRVVRRCFQRFLLLGFKSGSERDSNPRPQDYDSRALTS